MGTIANLNVMLTASIGGFSATMKSAASTLTSVGESAVGMATGIGAITGALTGIAGGAGLALLIKDTMESMAATGRLSDRMGIATEKLTGMQYAAKLAGVSSETLTGGLEKMLHSIGEAESGTGTAGMAFERLGINVKQLAAMSPDQAFGSIAEGLKNIQNPAERAAVVMEIFGKSGQELLPMMMEGKEGIAAAQREAEKLGLTFNRVDAAKVELANQSFVRLQAVLEGAAQTLAIQLAPFIEVVTNKLVALATTGGGVGRFIVSAFGTVLKVVASLADWLALLDAGWQVLRSIASFAIGGIIDGLGYLMDGLDALAKKFGATASGMGKSLHQFAGDLYEVGKDAGNQVGKDWDTFTRGKNSQAATRFMQQVQSDSNSAAQSIAKAASTLNTAGGATDNWAKRMADAAERAKKITETLADLRKEAATVGMSENDKKIYGMIADGATPQQTSDAIKLVQQIEKLNNAKTAADSIKELEKELRQLNFTDAQKKVDDIKLPGVSPEALARVKALAEQLDNAKEGKSIFDATRTPMEKYEQQITKLSNLLNSGAINWNTYGRAVRQARAELEKAAEARSPELLDSGTAQADKYLYEQRNAKAFDFTSGARQQDANKDRIEQMQYSEAYQSRVILQRIENKLTDSNAVPTQTVEIA